LAHTKDERAKQLGDLKRLQNEPAMFSQMNLPGAIEMASAKFADAKD